MSWNCPACGLANRDELIRCVCGYEIDSEKYPNPSSKPLSAGNVESLKKTYAEWETEKLQHAITEGRKDYEDHAISLMEEELKKRGALCTESLELQTVKSSLKANKKIVEERICNICNGKFSIGEEIEECEKCGNFFHHKCWEEKEGCNSSECKEDTKSCPNCGKEIKKTALKCRYCGQYIDENIKEKLLPKGELKEASGALTYSLIGILCFGFILGPVAIHKGIKALKIIRNEPGYKGKGKAIAGIVIGSIVTLLNILGLIVKLSGR